MMENVEEAQPISEEVTLPEGVRLRLKVFYDAQQAINQRIEDTTLAALEGMGKSGQVRHLNVDTGIVTLETANVVPMNRAQRRKAKKAQ